MSAGMALIFGLVEYSNIARNPRFEAIRTVDVVGLLRFNAALAAKGLRKT